MPKCNFNKDLTPKSLATGSNLFLLLENDICSPSPNFESMLYLYLSRGSHLRISRLSKLQNFETGFYRRN